MKVSISSSNKEKLHEEHRSLHTSNATIMIPDQSSQVIGNQQRPASCFLSTTIFGINFISAIAVINLSKWLYVKHNFPNLTLTTINFFITFTLLLVCLHFKLVTHVRLPVIKMIPVSACFGGFITFSNLSLQYNTVGTYQLIKLQVTPTLMLISWIFFNIKCPLPIVFSFFPVLIGTLISTYYDLQFNIFGLFCAVVSVVFTAIYQVLVEHYQKIYRCDSLQLLLYQAPICGIMMMCLVPFYEPLNNLSEHFTINTISLIILCGLMAFFVNFSVFWVIGNLSAVAYNMIGHSKTILIILIGSILFNEHLNQRQIFGLLFTMIGVFLYTYFKFIKQTKTNDQSINS